MSKEEVKWMKMKKNIFNMNGGLTHRQRYRFILGEKILNQEQLEQQRKKVKALNHDDDDDYRSL